MEWWSDGVMAGCLDWIAKRFSAFCLLPSAFMMMAGSSDWLVKQIVCPR
jgi:hypothetical protein